MGKKINDHVLDELLTGCERPKDLLGHGGPVHLVHFESRQHIASFELT